VSHSDSPRHVTVAVVQSAFLASRPLPVLTARGRNGVTTSDQLR